MKTLVIQSYRTRDVPAWIERCLASVKAWTQARGYDHRMTDDAVFDLCGPDYLARAGQYVQAVTDLARLELIRIAHRDGYDRAVWIDADVFVFDPDNLHLPAADRITFAKETWIDRASEHWSIRYTLHNAIVVCPAGDADIDFIIQATRHTAQAHPVCRKTLLGVELLRGLHTFLGFPLMPDVGMLSHHTLLAIARGDDEPLNLQARHHRTPIHAGNLCGSASYDPAVPEAVTLRAMDLLESTRGGVINDRLRRPAARALARP